MIDLHSDTVYALWSRGGEETLLSNSLSISRDTLIRGGVRGQCFALFTPMHEHIPEGKRHLSPWEILNELHDRFSTEMERAAIPILTDPSQLKDGALHAILTTEEGAAIEGDISRLSILHSWGVRIFGLTWNYENELGYPNSKDPEVMGKGLKEKGFEAIEECSRLGMLVDVSHLSDGGFSDVAATAKGPFVATHSNARAVTDVPRNLTDSQLRTLADHGGVAGLNLCPAFLHDGKASSPEDAESRICDMVRHVMHIYRTAGSEVLAIGTDFDGIEGKLEIRTHEDMPKLFDALSDAGLPPSAIDMMAYGNAARVISSICPGGTQGRR